MNRPWPWPEEDGIKIVGALPLRAITGGKRRKITLPKLNVRGGVQSLVEVAGIAAVIYGIYLLFAPAAFIAGGLVAVAPAVVRNLPARRPPS